MVIRLKPGTNQNFFLYVPEKIILHRFYIAMNIYIAYICFINSAFRIFIMQSPRVGKPTPGTFSCDLIASIIKVLTIIFCLRLITGQA